MEDLPAMLEYIKKLENNKDVFAKLQRGKKEKILFFIFFLYNINENFFL